MFHQIMTLNNKKLGLTFRPTNHSHLLYLHVFMIELPTLSEKAKGCLKSVYRENTFGRSMYLLSLLYYSVHLSQCCQDSLTVQQFKVKV